MQKFLISFLCAFVPAIVLGVDSPSQGQAVAVTVPIYASTQALKRASAPANVIPIDMTCEVRDPSTGQVGMASAACSAMRLTPTVILTAAHCFVECFAHNSLVYAEPFVRENGQWELRLLKSNEEMPFEKNARVIYYRPNYQSDEKAEAASHAFDFALLKLDGQLRPNASMASSELEKASANVQQLPPELVKLMGSRLMQAFKQSLTGPSQTYLQFLQVPLEKFDLLQMSPDMVKNELKNSRIRAYLWGGDENIRYPMVQVFEGTCAGTDKKHRNTHTLLFDVHTEPGTSGSPFLDNARHLVVSVNSGPMNGYSTGGLISEQVCAWVKQHAPEVKCLAVMGGAKYEETPQTQTWGK